MSAVVSAYGDLWMNFRPLNMHLAAESQIKATLTNYNIQNTIEMTAVGSPAHIAIYHTRWITISKSVWPPNASHQTRVKRARPNLEVSYNSYDSFSLWAKMDPSPSVPRPSMCGEIREDPWRIMEVNKTETHETVSVLHFPADTVLPDMVWHHTLPETVCH